MLVSRSTWIAVLALTACGDSGEAPPAAPTTPSAARTTALVTVAPRPPSSASASGQESAAVPTHMNYPDIEYPLGSVRAIEASCTKPWVIVDAPGAGRETADGEHGAKEPHPAGSSSAKAGPAASAAPSASPSASARTEPAGPSFETAVDQALLANPSFGLVAAEPSTGGEIAVDVIAEGAHGSGASMLLARCHDAGTCTRFASMVHAVVRGATAETGCGEPSSRAGAKPIRALAPALPDASDRPALCARVGACLMTRAPEATQDPIAACLAAPSGPKAECARMPTCDGVLECH